MRRLLEARDVEILRSLARLHYLSAAQINGAFFPSAKVGWRRIAELGGRNYIRRQLISRAGRSQSVYRLTPHGVSAVFDEFPDEPHLDGLEAKLEAGPPPDVYHAEAVAELYLQLVRGDERPEDGGVEALRLWMAEVRDRANRLHWRADGAVTLDFRVGGGERRIVPDATVAAPTAGVRIFVEIDRSNKPLGRLEDNLQRYATYCRTHYAKDFTDGLTPIVAYVLKSDARRHNVAALMKRWLASDIRWVALVSGLDAVPWFARELFAEERAVPLGGTLATTPASAPPSANDVVASRFLRSTSELLAALEKQEPSLFQFLRKSDLQFVQRWRDELQLFGNTFGSVGDAR